MSILWMGGEDIDFPNGGAVSVDTSGGHYRSGFARSAVYQNSMGTWSRSTQFQGGAITSGWVSARLYTMNNFGNTGYNMPKVFGLGLSGTNKGLFIGSASGAGNGAKIALVKSDGTTDTQLAAEGGASLGVNSLFSVALQVVNYGASATVNVFVNGVLVISYTGDVTVTGMTNFDCVTLVRTSGQGNVAASEVIVADEDVRGFQGLVTLALTAAGTTDQWTGLYSTINQAAFSDTTPNYSNTNNQDQQFNVTDLPGALGIVPIVKITARMAKSASTPTKVGLGYNSGGTVGFGTGADKTLDVVYATFEQYDTVNPVTGVQFTQSEVNALQLNLRAKA